MSNIHQSFKAKLAYMNVSPGSFYEFKWHMYSVGGGFSSAPCALEQNLLNHNYAISPVFI